MTREEADQIVTAVEAAREADEYSSAYAACKAAGVSVSAYKEARLIAYGLNEMA
ncbi:hypothetical protein [Pseudomonas sp. PLB05]|uniref:hypothetical protein n=1 Tax=Pseudomonas sp. PLB05 TaxID=2899078 RepID=UPI001E5ECF9E|nr:hypothetical protein [Pseudomonas sp. PLB05]MCD4867017.1 hypothetical protein [Pseudomonas sp. PLB05]